MELRARSRFLVHPSRPGNDALGPERTTEVEFGMDGAWLEGRFSAESPRIPEDLGGAVLRDIARQRGELVTQLTNVGELQNQGYEIMTNTTLLDMRSFRWDLGLGLATNFSKTLDLGGRPRSASVSTAG